MPRIAVDQLKPFFSPEAVAIIGASSDRTKIGGRPIHNMKIAGYKGGIYPINPNYPEIQGIKAYKSLADVDAPVDMAIVVVPQKLVKGAISDCIAKGVKAAIVLSSGFAEIDEKGAVEQREITAMRPRPACACSGPTAWAR